MSANIEHEVTVISGSAGGRYRRAKVNLCIECAADTVEEVRRLYAAAPELLAALDNVVIGGNHLATVLIRNLGPDFASLWPPYTNPDDVLRKFGSSDNYEGWVCWSKIMQARAALAKAKGE